MENIQPVIHSNYPIPSIIVEIISRFLEVPDNTVQLAHDAIHYGKEQELGWKKYAIDENKPN